MKATGRHWTFHRVLAPRAYQYLEWSAKPSSPLPEIPFLASLFTTKVANDRVFTHWMSATDCEMKKGHSAMSWISYILIAGSTSFNVSICGSVRNLNEPFVLHGKEAVSFPPSDVSCRPIQIYVLRNVLCGVGAMRSCLAARSLTDLRVGKPVFLNTCEVNLFLQNQTFHEYFRRYKNLFERSGFYSNVGTIFNHLRLSKLLQCYHHFEQLCGVLHGYRAYIDAAVEQNVTKWYPV